MYNELNMSDIEIEETVIRAKVFIINDKNEALIALPDGGVQLPGGYVENGEELIDTVKREVLEKT